MSLYLGIDCTNGECVWCDDDGNAGRRYREPFQEWVASIREGHHHLYAIIESSHTMMYELGRWAGWCEALDIEVVHQRMQSESRYISTSTLMRDCQQIVKDREHEATLLISVELIAELLKSVGSEKYFTRVVDNAIPEDAEVVRIEQSGDQIAVTLRSKSFKRGDIVNPRLQQVSESELVRLNQELEEENQLLNAQLKKYFDGND